MLSEDVAARRGKSQKKNIKIKVKVFEKSCATADSREDSFKIPNRFSPHPSPRLRLRFYLFLITVDYEISVTNYLISEFNCGYYLT